MKNKRDFINGVFVAFGVFGMLVVVFLLSSANCTTNHGGLGQTAAAGESAGKLTPVRLPEELDFAGENIPLENFDIREALDKEMLVNTFWHSQTFLLIKRANRFFPVIEPILKKNGIPDDFKFLAMAESGLTNVVSPAGASGFWQFIKPTAIQYGLEVNDEVDERYNIEKATEAACKFLKRSYSIYKSWTLTAASYNMGRTGLNKQIARQYSDNYFDILLNDETARYVFRIASLKAIINNPEAYGFEINGKDLYPPFQSENLEVNSSVDDLAKFAFQHGTNYKMLKMLNPWLRDNVLTNKTRKTYTLKIPVKGFRNIEEKTEKTEIDSIMARSARQENE